MRLAELRRVADAGPLGEGASRPPSRRICRAVSSASASEAPRRTGKAPRRISIAPLRPSNSSDLPMKRIGRFVAAATKNASQKLLWFGVTITGPSAGIRSACSIESA